MTSPSKFLRWTRENPGPFKHRAIQTFSYARRERKFRRKKISAKISLSYAILRGSLEFFPLTPL
jgi:hypothetical protein